MRVLLVLLAFLAAPAWAVQPDEVLDDPVLESRARALGQELRCLVCRNESIDESSAGFARDLRLLVRERLVAGDSDAEVLDFLVARYGEYVLLRPPLRGNLTLWLTAPALLLLGAGGAVLFIRRGRKTPVAPAPLTADERARLAALLEQPSGRDT
ncbi:MAG: cytochrome c-type biogenesis protein [Pseudomonadota bacterium]